MVRNEDLGLFLRSAALGSFSATAREADLLPGQVSAAIKRLERDLGVRLFARSTRSLRLTAEGEQYLPFARGAIDTLRDGHELLREHTAEPRGVLQIAAPSDLGRNLLLPALAAFRRRHPALALRLFLSDQVSDVYKDPVDVAIRYGQIADQSVVAWPLAPDNRRVLVAAPRYLAEHGRPHSLQALVDHACLRFVLQGRVYDKWVFPEAGRRRVVPVDGPLLSDDADVVRRWAIDGEGIAYKSWLDVRPDVLAGRLEVLLPAQPGETVPLHLVCPHRRQFSVAVRLLHAFLQPGLTAMTAELPGGAATRGSSPPSAAPAPRTSRRAGRAAAGRGTR